MRSYRKAARIGVLVLVAALLVAQLFRIDRTNPPVSSDALMDPAVKPVLKRACYDCHSNETLWPWYSGIAPVSWLVGSDVSEGRRELNFSEWGTYSKDVQARKLKAVAEEVQDGDMPPWYYSIMHRESRLNQQERDQIRAWVDTEISGDAPKKQSSERCCTLNPTVPDKREKTLQAVFATNEVAADRLTAPILATGRAHSASAGLLLLKRGSKRADNPKQFQLPPEQNLIGFEQCQLFLLK